MKVTLKYLDYNQYGIFGDLTFEDEPIPFCVILTHAFPKEDGTYAPATPPGTYTCVRGTHRLEHGDPFVTFEITRVEGHTGILFHVGNYNKDSEGCILVGKERWVNMITNSAATFAGFMGELKDVNEFTLEIK